MLIMCRRACVTHLIFRRCVGVFGLGGTCGLGCFHIRKMAESDTTLIRYTKFHNRSYTSLVYNISYDDDIRLSITRLSLYGLTILVTRLWPVKQRINDPNHQQHQQKNRHNQMGAMKQQVNDIQREQTTRFIRG